MEEADGIILCYRKSFDIKDGVVNKNFDARNENNRRAIIAIRDEFQRIYDRGCKGPGQVEKQQFEYEVFPTDRSTDIRKIGKILNMVVRYKMSRTFTNNTQAWRWSHPLDIVRGCDALLEATE